MQNRQKIDLETLDVTELQALAYQQIVERESNNRAITAIEQELVSRSKNPVMSPTTSTAPVEAVITEKIEE